MSNMSDALDLITRYGGFDGSHHKQWVLDQVVRILTRDIVGGYELWRKLHAEGEDGPNTYGWDEGIAP